MPLPIDTYKSIFLEPDWLYQKYNGWEIVVEYNNLKVLVKNIGLIKRYLVLSQLNHEELSEELTKLAIFTPLSLITIKDFSSKYQNHCAELLIDGMRIPKANESERSLNKYTFVIDLTQESDSLWNNMYSDNRRVCRKAIASGMVVESTLSPTEELLTLFFERYKKMANEHSLAIPDIKRIRKMFNDGYLCMYYAKNGNTICSIALVYSVDLTSIYLYGVPGEQRNDGSGQFVQWKVIEHLKELGQRWYDLGGVPEISDSNGIYRFKKSLGGEGFDLGHEFYYCPFFLSIAKHVYKKIRTIL